MKRRKVHRPQLAKPAPSRPASRETRKMHRPVPVEKDATATTVAPGVRTGKPYRIKANSRDGSGQREPVQVSRRMHRPDPVRVRAVRERAFMPKGRSWDEIEPGVFRCTFGCKLLRSSEVEINDDHFHAWDCAYWVAVGVDETPF